MLLTLFFLLQTVFAQDQVNSTLTAEEIQFRDSIAAINTSNERMQLVQETYNAASSAFAESNFSNCQRVGSAIHSKSLTIIFMSAYCAQV